MRHISIWRGWTKPPASFGWVSQDTGYKDSDYSVYAYTGAGVGSFTGLTYTDAAMLAAGGRWSGITRAGAAPEPGRLPASLYSSYWLIGALNGTNDSKKDAFKLLSVSGNTCKDSPGGSAAAAVKSPSRAPCCWWASACWG